jgi:hypothetical protein
MMAAGPVAPRAERQRVELSNKPEADVKAELNRLQARTPPDKC